jgi:hypothetical protein
LSNTQLHLGTIKVLARVSEMIKKDRLGNDGSHG